MREPAMEEAPERLQKLFDELGLIEHEYWDCDMDCYMCDVRTAYGETRCERAMTRDLMARAYEAGRADDQIEHLENEILRSKMDMRSFFMHGKVPSLSDLERLNERG